MTRRDGAAEAGSFLARLAGGDPIIPADHLAVVVAHPDDETIGVGGTLARLRKPWLVHVTDGAPANLRDASAHGFKKAAEYAAARRKELQAALSLAGVPAERLLRCGISDQAGAEHIVEIVRMLRRVFACYGVRIVLTHPFEGGHPDHDATAFAVHAACELAGPLDAPAIVEMASYHAGPEGLVTQRFAADGEGLETAVVLGSQARARKAAMLAEHRTQAATLAPFSPDADERFRLAPTYDFTALPNGGRLHYERFEWGVTGKDWVRLASDAHRALGLAAKP